MAPHGYQMCDSGSLGMAKIYLRGVVVIGNFRPTPLNFNNLEQCEENAAVRGFLGCFCAKKGDQEAAHV